MNKTNEFLDNVKSLLTLNEAVKEYSKQTIPYSKYTFEELDIKAKGLGYTGWRDERYIGVLKKTINQFEMFNKTNSFVIVDNLTETVYWSYGYSGQMLFEQLTGR